MTRPEEGRRYPREFLLTELRRVAKELRKIPTMVEFRRYSKISPVTLEKRFKGWNAALQSAGFDPGKARLTYDDLELLEELHRVARLIGETPNTTRFAAESKMPISTIARRFGGSWEAACRAAGLPPPKKTAPTNVIGGWNKGQTKIHISADELRYLYETEGLSASSIGVRLGASVQTITRLLRRHGIPIRRLTYSMPRETTIETLMYGELERRGVTFVKQSVIDGLWVVDALVPGPKVVVECDGEYWHSKPEMERRDRRKDAYLRSHGYTVLRFPESAIRADIKQCVEKVVSALVQHYTKEYR